ncbi:GNAT family N-acetyltransferase [Sporichthya sp.]|uniref:GNAT family N-acetyltransferase n=1 Tax=Sporichthya sp. TaxID=65475 RepID=UPI0018024ED8|nr:GNAT family N-acetyltransferase [Sporichthya sp.]MBA3742719.1 GNAT family N-acetyltransferase [Sporichthya sp.]
MEIQVLDPARVDEFVAVFRAAHDVDHPQDPAYALRHEALRILNPTPDEPITHFMVLEAGRIVAGAHLRVPELDNTHSVFVEIIVDPDARRRGIARELWDFLTARALGLGRKLVLFETAIGGAGEAFGRSINGEVGILDARRRLVVDTANLAVAAELKAEALTHADGYELVSYVGSTPEQWIDGVAYLVGRMSTDAPMDGLDWQAEAYDANRIRMQEAATVRQELTVFSTIAVHTATGTVAGFTNIGRAVDDGTNVHQWNTIVDPDHRGHRLGTLIKIANLEQARQREPGIGAVWTWNAVSNDPMIRVNEAMGFRLWDHWGEWQVRL